MNRPGNCSTQVAAAVLWGLLACPAGMHAESSNVSGLLQNSPFGGQSAPGAVGHDDAPLEFRSVLVDGGEEFFSLYETSSQISRWVGLNETGKPFAVRNYDSAKGIVTVEYHGHMLNLPLKETKALRLPPPPVPPQIQAVSGSQSPKVPPPPAVPDIQALLGSPTEDAATFAARRDSVLAEIRRLRGRIQAAQANGSNP